MQNAIVETVAKNIRGRRKQLKMSRKTLAEKLQRHEGTIYQWESCKREISSEDLISVAAALGVKWLWLYQDHADHAEGSVQPNADPSRYELFERFLEFEKVHIQSSPTLQEELGRYLAQAAGQ